VRIAHTLQRDAVRRAVFDVQTPLSRRRFGRIAESHSRRLPEG
jgi:hypothetical protein